MQRVNIALHVCVYPWLLLLMWQGFFTACWLAAIPNRVVHVLL
jgi:hypothetical protein